MAKRPAEKKRQEVMRKSARAHVRRRSRARARRRPVRVSAREGRDRHVIEIRTNVGQATEHVRRAGLDIAEAGGAGAALVRDAAMEATERAGEAVDTARERAGEAVGVARRRAGEAMETARETATETAGVLSETASEAAGAVTEGAQRAARVAGRTAVGLTAGALHLPEMVRERARRGVERAEEVGAGIVAGVLNAGSRALNVAADYVSEIVPRRRVRRSALELLVLEQLAWAQAGTDALERVAGEIDDGGLRVQLVRAKLQSIRHGETLTQLLGRLGARMHRPDQMPRVEPASTDGHPRAGRVRHDLARALSCAEQQADGWRALAQIAAGADSEAVAMALAGACEIVGTEAEEQVALLRDAVIRRTTDTVLV
jgi:hypothetical protein